MRRPKPFYRKQTKSWYVQIGKKQINLGKDEGEAWKAYDRLTAKQQQPEPSSDETINRIFNRYLVWCRRLCGLFRFGARSPILLFLLNLFSSCLCFVNATLRCVYHLSNLLLIAWRQIRLRQEPPFPSYPLRLTLLHLLFVAEVTDNTNAHGLPNL